MYDALDRKQENMENIKYCYSTFFEWRSRPVLTTVTSKYPVAVGVASLSNESLPGNFCSKVCFSFRY